LAALLPFVELIEWLSGGFSLERSIANAHLLFNVIGVVAFAPFAGLFSRVLLSIIPPKG
jgi:Na+/phosphate symporter